MDAIQYFNEDYNELKEALKDVTPTKPVFYTMAEFVIQLFCMIFWYEAPLYLVGDADPGVSRSNWTAHVAYSIRKSANFIGLNCLYEIMGRLDAVIQTVDENPKILLLAEWEWDSLSVFGEKKELEKLWEGTKGLTEANAFLFTYCGVGNDYTNFVRKVVQYWQEKAATNRKSSPILYLTVAQIEYDVSTSREIMYSPNTIEIHAEGVKVWRDPILYRASYHE